MDYTILVDFIKDFWGVIIVFLTLGVNWYWNSKRTKNQLNSEQIDNKVKEKDVDVKEVEVESKEIENMKELFNIFTQQFKGELLSKNNDNKMLSDLVNELKNKVEILSDDVKKLTKMLEDKDIEMLEIANKCKNRKNTEVCVVLDHLKNKQQ